MGYLRLKRSQWIIGSFVLFALLVVIFPSIDIQISRLFFDGKSFWQNEWQQRLLHDGLNLFLVVSLGAVFTIYALNRIWQRNHFGIDGRKVAYLILVLMIGPGLVVNVVLKDNFGRARPRSVIEFGGTKHFTPAFTVSRECQKNCSFTSGDAAAGFFSLALATALSKRRSVYVVALAIGLIFASGRMVSGAHFFSDTVASFFVMLIVTDVLRYYILLKRPSLEDGRPAESVA